MRLSLQTYLTPVGNATPLRQRDPPPAGDRISVKLDEPVASAPLGGSRLNSSEETPSRRSEAVYYLVAIVVGTLTGLVGTALHLGVDRALAWPLLLRSYVDVDEPHYLLLTGGIAAVLVVVSVWIVRMFAPEAGGSGVQEIEGAMEGLRTIRWLRVLLVKFFGGFLALGSGLVVGREGPTIHMGGSIAQAASEGLKLPTRENRGLLAAGAAAGLAAAFSAPLASILFVIEETRRQFPYSLKTYTGVILASVVSGIVTHAIAGPRPFMASERARDAARVLARLRRARHPAGSVSACCSTVASFGPWTLPYGSAPSVVLHCAGSASVSRWACSSSSAPKRPWVARLFPSRWFTNTCRSPRWLLIVAVRFVMTMASYSTGVPGGIFAPILAMATALGLLYGLCLEFVMPLPAGRRRRHSRWRRWAAYSHRRSARRSSAWCCSPN